jgi:CcmD family protein
MSDLGFLALGYGLIWVLIGAYVFFISRRQAALRRHLEQLQLEIGETAEKLGRERPSTEQAESTGEPGDAASRVAAV